jgi:hypothetical protein
VKKRFEWSPQARSDLREIEREQAMQILMALTRYGQTGEGDIKHLRKAHWHTPPPRGRLAGPSSGKERNLIYILAVSNRSEAYR